MEDILKNIEVWKSISFGGVVMLVIISIIKGWLIPSKICDQMISDKQTQIDRLWQARKVDEETIRCLTAQLDQLRAAGDMSIPLLHALKKVAEDEAEEVGRRVVVGEVAQITMEERR